MKIEVARPDLQNALSVASLGTGSSTDLSAHYLFRLRGGKAEVLSSEMRVFTCSPFIATVEGDEGDAFTVEAWRLDKWVAGVGDGVLKFASENGEVTATSGRSKVRFRSLDPARFPYWDSLMDTPTDLGSIDPASLAQALSVSRWFVSAEDTTKPELCQVEAVKGVLWATDRRALSSFQISYHIHTNRGFWGSLGRIYRGQGGLLQVRKCI